MTAISTLRILASYIVDWCFPSPILVALSIWMLLSLMIPPASSAQHRLYFRNWNDYSNIPSLNVTDIETDADGFVWVATQSGLARFDGYDFVTLKHTDPVDKPIIGSIISSLQLAPDGMLWVATRSGVSVVDTRTLRVQWSLRLPKRPMAIRFSDRDRSALVSTQGSSYLVAPDGTVTDSLSATQHGITFPTGSRTLLASKNDSLYFYHLKVKNGRLERIDTYSYPVTSPKFDYVFSYNDSTLLRSDEKGTLFMDLFPRYRSGSIKTITLGTGYQRLKRQSLPLAVTRESDGSFWIQKRGKLILFERLPGENLRFREIAISSEEDDPHGLRAVSIVQMHSTGRYLWIGDNSEGLTVLDKRQFAFKHIQPDRLSLSGITRNTVWNSSVSPQKDLMIGTDHGLIVSKGFFSRPLYAARTHQVADTELIHVTKSGEHLSVINSVRRSDDIIYNIYRDGIYRFNLNTRANRKIFPLKSATAPINRFTSHRILDDSTYFWTEYRSLWLQDHRTLKMTRLPYDGLTGSVHTILSHQVTTTNNGDRIAWIGESAGLHLYNIDRQTAYTDLKFVDRLDSLMQGKTVMAFDISRDSMLWVGTLNAGLVRLDMKQGNYRIFTEKEGLSSYQIHGLLIDHKNRIWIGTSRGIDCLTDNGKSILNFSRSEGIASSEFSQNAYTRNGEYLQFGGNAGLTLFHPDSVINVWFPTGSLRPSRLHFTRLSSDTPPDRFYFPSSRLEIPHSDNSFELSFTHQEYGKPSAQMAYRLGKKSRDWIKIPTGENSVAFSNLSGGLHTLLVSTVEDNGTISPQMLEMALYIIPPFWRTTPFMIVASLIAVGLIGTVAFKISGFISSKEIRRLEQQQQVYSERERLSRDLHDSIGSQLSIILKHLEQVEPQELGQSPIRLSAARESALLTMKQLRETIWALKKERITVSAMADRFESLVSRNLQGTGIRLKTDKRISADHEVEPILMLNLLRILQESVNNILKYSEADEVRLAIRSLPRQLSLTISDNGVGFVVPENAEKESYGLSNIRKRAEQIGAQAEIDSESGKGTRIHILKSFTSIPRDV